MWLYLTDLHLRSTPPRGRRDDFVAAIDAKMARVAELCQEHQVELILCGGDLFHRPQPSYETFLRAAALILATGVPWLVVPGNHDMQYGQRASADKTALGALSELNIVAIPPEFSYSAASTGFIPRECSPSLNSELYHDEDFLSNNPADLIKIAESGTTTIGNYSFGAIPYAPGIEEKMRHGIPEAEVLVAHAMVTMNPFRSDYVLTAELAGSARLFLSGHYHPGFDVHERGETVFANPGALTRLSRHQSDRCRTPQIALIDENNLAVRYVPVAELTEVFREERRPAFVVPLGQNLNWFGDDLGDAEERLRQRCLEQEKGAELWQVAKVFLEKARATTI